MPPRTPITRRTFLKVSFSAGGSLLIGSYLGGCTTEEISPTSAPTAAPTVPPTATPGDGATPVEPPTATPIPEPPFEPNLFVRIDADGTATLTVHRSEMGQGVRTAFAMILAEELEVDWSKVRVEQSLANSAIGDQLTGGSTSIQSNYSSLRQAGATARAILIAAAAQTWGVGPESCQAENGIVTNTATGDQLSYGELVKAAKDIELETPVTLKDPKDFRLIGLSIPRIDEPEIVTGKAVYGLDVRLPGMLFAAIARCPVVIGGKVASYDGTQAQAVPGVKAVIQISNGIVVIAENTWAALQGRQALNITWDEGANASLSSESIHQQLVDQMTEAIADETPGDFTTIEAVYETPYLAHAPMEPVNCTADVRADHGDIWAATQNPQGVQSYSRSKAGVPVDVHVPLLGGGFGRRLEVDYGQEAAEVSRAVNAPVQVVWTREDDIQHDFYRQVTYHWLRAGWDAEGKVGLWRHYVAGAGINGVAFGEGSGVLNQGLAVPYNIHGSRSQTLLAKIPIPTGYWRSVMNGPNAFANEAFFDEVAATLQRDPYELRMELLPESNPLRPVLELAATKAGWRTPLPEGHGRGIACHTTWSVTSVAMVAEASVQNHRVRVHKMVCAIDCGLVIHPDLVAQQMESSISLGLTSLLMGEITFEKGRVQQRNFTDYPLLQMDEMPEVEVYFVPSERQPTGIGEMGIPVVAPAVANAIFAASGLRIRRMPIRAEDLRVEA